METHDFQVGDIVIPRASAQLEYSATSRRHAYLGIVVGKGYIVSGFDEDGDEYEYYVAEETADEEDKEHGEYAINIVGLYSGGIHLLNVLKHFSHLVQNKKPSKPSLKPDYQFERFVDFETLKKELSSFFLQGGPPPPLLFTHQVGTFPVLPEHFDIVTDRSLHNLQTLSVEMLQNSVSDRFATQRTKDVHDFYELLPLYLQSPFKPASPHLFL